MLGQRLPGFDRATADRRPGHQRPFHRDTDARPAALSERLPDPREIAALRGLKTHLAEGLQMMSTTTLLVTCDGTVISNVQRLHDELEHARLEVCGQIGRAHV